MIQNKIKTKETMEFCSLFFERESEIEARIFCQARPSAVGMEISEAQLPVFIQVFFRFESVFVSCVLNVEHDL